MNLTFLIVSLLFFAYSLRFSFFWWFRSKEYLKMSRKRRREYRRTLFFMPQTLLFDYYDQNPEFERWINRIVGLVFLSASILGVVVAIHGPFKV